MSIDTSKIKVGDTVKAEFVVNSISCINGVTHFLSLSPYSSWIRGELIVEHTSKPKEITVGTQFPATPLGRGMWTVISVKEGWAWCEHPDWEMNTFRIEVILDRLTNTRFKQFVIDKS